MNKSDFSKQTLNEFKEKMKQACDEVLSEAYCEVLPHAETDLFANVSYRTQSAIELLLSGNYKVIDSNKVLISVVDGLDVEVKITTSQWDLIRKTLIDSMPACPKDLEIESLKKQLEFKLSI